MAAGPAAAPIDRTPRAAREPPHTPAAFNAASTSSGLEEIQRIRLDLHVFHHALPVDDE